MQCRSYPKEPERGPEGLAGAEGGHDGSRISHVLPGSRLLHMPLLPGTGGNNDGRVSVGQVGGPVSGALP